MNVCLQMFYTMDALTVLYINDDSKSLKKKNVYFLHSFSIEGFDVGTLFQWSALKAFYTVRWITGLVDRHNSAWSPRPPTNVELISVVLCLTPPPLWSPRRPRASVPTGRQTPPERVHTGDCSTSWSGSAVVEFNAPKTCTASYISSLV